MEVKYFAVIIILFISFYIALLIKKRCQKRIDVCQSLYNFVEYIKNQIEFFCTPTRQIIDSYEDELLSECKLLPAEDELEDAVVKSELSSYIAPGILHSFEDFAFKLGRSGPEEQISNCNYMLYVLGRYLDDERNEMPKKSKVYSALSVVSGFMAAILLL